MMTDITIPFNMLQFTKRYKDALTVIESREGTPYEIRLISAHSLGSAIAERIAQKYPNKKYRLYGSPSIYGNDNPNVKYFRHPFDPISGFNIMKNRHQTYRFTDPHGYKGYRP